MSCSQSSALLLFLIVALIPMSAPHLPEATNGRPIRGPASTGPNAVQSPSGSPADIEKLSGDYKLIVILVEFTDIKHETSRDVIHNLVFTKMNKYWRDVSYNQFNVIGDTVGWFNLGHDEVYYGKSTDPKDPRVDEKDHELIQDACKLASSVDFTQYQDIMVVFAGHGQESDPKNNTDLIWPHGWWDWSGISCGGREFKRGGYAGEVVYERLDLGTITHEFGHTIGLPDLYNTDPDAPDYWKTGIDYVGLWSLMASGSWGGPNYEASDPVGLEAWSRIKLGWLSSVSVPLTADGFVQPLNGLQEATGPRALKVRTTGSGYYLFEARARVGLDEYLPNTGVLITRIDESKESGEGIVQVMDCHPGTKSIDDATCKVNESWSDKSENIYVKFIGKQGSSYIVAVASRPITALKGTYMVELSLAGVPPSANATITVDGSEYGSIMGIEKSTLMFLVGSSHTLTLSQYVMFGEDTRYYAVDNTITVTKQGTYTIRYLQQNRLLIEIATGTSEKWLAPDQSETLGPYDDIMQVDAGTRYLFVSISVDGVTRQSRSIALTMDRPHIVKVNSRKQYFLGIESEFGDPKGEGWYDAGSETRYSVTTPYGFLIQHIFASWTGDVTSSEPQGTLTMTRPYVIKANWREDYTQLILLTVLLGVVAGAIGLKARTRRKPPLDAQESRTVGTAQTEAYGGVSHWCISCGRQIMQDSIFCEHCGATQPE